MSFCYFAVVKFEIRYHPHTFPAYSTPLAPLVSFLYLTVDPNLNILRWFRSKSPRFPNFPVFWWFARFFHGSIAILSCFVLCCRPDVLKRTAPHRTGFFGCHGMFFGHFSIHSSDQVISDYQSRGTHPFPSLSGWEFYRSPIDKSISIAIFSCFVDQMFLNTLVISVSFSIYPLITISDVYWSDRNGLKSQLSMEFSIQINPLYQHRWYIL